MRFISRSSPVSHPAANCLSRRWAYTLVEPQLDETGTADWQPQQASGCAADAQNQVRHVAAGSRAFATVVAVFGGARPAFRADDKSIGTTSYEQSTA